MQIMKYHNYPVIPMGHNAVSTMDECMSPPDTEHHQIMLKRQGHKQIAISLVANINPISVGYIKNK